MKEKDRYIVFSIVLFVEILALMIFIYCEGDMWIKKILCNLECVTIGIFLILFPVVVGISIIAKSFNYTGDTVHISKDDLHYKSNFKSAKEIYIAKDVVNIPYKHFSGLTMLQYVEFEGENTTISENAFEGCEKLERVYLPSKLTKIRDNTFKDCKKLKNVTIPDSVIEIGIESFAGCSSLTNVKIGNGVIKIEDNAFSGCKNVETLVIGDGLTSLDNLPITPELKSITIGNNVTEIGMGAFKNCEKLEKITIPDSVTKIGDNAFADCRNQIVVNYRGSEEKWEKIDIGSGNESLKVKNYNYEGN